MAENNSESFIHKLENGLSTICIYIININVIYLLVNSIGTKYYGDQYTGIINKISIIPTIICIAVFLSQILYTMNSNLDYVNVNSYVIESIFWWFIMFAILLLFTPSEQMDNS
jgi:hypothetical protein